MQDKARIIQEYVPGKQITIAHVIANPKPEVYKKLVNTPATMLLNTAKGTMERVRLFLQDVDLTDTDEKGKVKYPINQITSALKDIPTLAKNYDEALRIITLELEENSKIRGQKDKTICEDGFDE